MLTQSVRKHHIPLAGPLTLFLLGGLLGLPASYDPALSAPWLLWLVAGAGLYCVIVLLVRDRSALVWAAALPVLAAAAGGLLLAAQYRHLDFDLKFGPVTGLGALTSAPFPPLLTTHIDANAAAGFLEGALPLAAGLALAARGWRRLGWSVCALLIVLGVLLTSSRGSWVALAVIALLGGLALLRRRLTTNHRRPLRLRSGQATTDESIHLLTRSPAHPLTAVVSGRRSVVALMAVALALVIALVVGQPAFQRVLASAAYRAADRLMLYRNSFFLAREFSFSGIGPGATFGEIYSRFELLILVPYVGYAHNLFLAVWLAQGLLGLLGFIALILASARLIWRGLRQDGGPIAWGAALGSLVVLLHGLTDAPQYDTSWTALLMAFALFGVALAAARLADDRPLTWVSLGRRRGLAFATVGLAVLIFAGPALLAAGSANAAAVLQARALLTPELLDATRADLRLAAVDWAEHGLAYDGDSVPALQRRGHLALDAGDYAGAITLLEPALAHAPADQALRKALGYAYIWDGRAAEGVRLLATLDRAAEVRQELDTWPVYWEQQGRADLAGQARMAVAAWDGQP